MITKTKRKKSKIYFGLAAQQGVEDFLLAEELQEKHKIFNERLHEIGRASCRERV